MPYAELEVTNLVSIKLSERHSELWLSSSRMSELWFLVRRNGLSTNKLRGVTFNYFSLKLA